MAGPLSGVGQSQVPLSTPFQPGGANAGQVRAREEQQDRQNQVQPEGASANQAQQTNAENDNVLRPRQDNVQSSRSEDTSSADQRRGSLVNIQV
jgi:hypothetical protein